MHTCISYFRRSLLLFTFLFFAQQIFAQQKAISQWPSAISYEIFVQSFCDSDGDGKGDINGLTSKLDYLKGLGIEALWLMPMSPSPTYHKYDVTDYYGIHPDYGTLEDFKIFIKEAHQRNIKVVIDLVLNHSSNKHPWFIDASQNENSKYRDYYVWTHKDDPQVMPFSGKTNEDSKNRDRWNKVEGSDYFYYSYFGRHMPDLNFDNPKLRNEVFNIGRYWLQDIGVDGFRMDAARHIYPDDRAKDNHNWWLYFLKEMQKIKKDVYIVGEVWSSADVVAPYLKGIPALFNFDMASALKKAVSTGLADSIAFKFKNIETFYSTVNPNFINATFLSNHDQERVMSSVGNDVAKAKLGASLLLTLPGAPYLYYGEEIGMIGKKPDEYIREPFLWTETTKDKNRASWVKPRYSNDQSVAPVSLQMKDKNSIYNFYKSLISLRNSSKALTYGTMTPIDLGNPAICVYTRNHEKENLLVIHNLSAKEINFTLPDYLSKYQQITSKMNEVALKKKALKIPAYSTVILHE